MAQNKKKPESAPSEEYKLLDPSEVTVSEELNSRFTLTRTDDLEADILKRGQLHPIICRKFGSEVLLVAGARRLRATRRINEVPGLLDEPMKVKALVRGDMDEKEAFLSSISENGKRKDVSILDTAWQASQLMKKYEMSQKEVAEHYGKGQSWVSRVCKLLTLNPDIRDKVASGDIGYTDALDLLGIEDKTERSETAARMISSGANEAKVTRREVRSKTRGGKKRAVKTLAEELAAGIVGGAASEAGGRRTLKQNRELFERWGKPNVERGEERKPIHSVCGAIAAFLDGKIQEKTLRKVLTGYLK